MSIAEIFVLIRFAGGKLGVPLSQVEAVESKLETREAAEDWHYWVTMSHTF
ncbi:MAG: calcium-binding protein [Pseudomonadota bacterium]|nr:calcium-binding protein [Pseudomonadota bacterium]